MSDHLHAARPIPWRLHLSLLALALAFPFVFPSNFMVNFGVMALFYAFIGQAWNISGGFAGQMSFGHVAFFGVGAYVSSVMQMRYGFSPWWGLPGAAFAGALVAGFVAVVSFRAGLKGSYFALITLAFGEVLRIISNSVDITGGGLGMLIPMKRSVANFQFEEQLNSIYQDVIREEKQCADYLFKFGPVIGLNANILKDFVDYTALGALKDIGIKYRTPAPKTTPIPWFNKHVNTSNKQTALQENESTNYVIGVMSDNLDYDQLPSL